MPADSRIQTVVLTVSYGVRASYYEDWLDAFEASPLFAVTGFNLFRRAERRAAMRAIGDAELVVALHPCSADTLRFITPRRARGVPRTSNRSAKSPSNTNLRLTSTGWSP